MLDQIESKEQNKENIKNSPIEKKNNQSLFGRLLEKIKGTFSSPKAELLSSLQGRVHESEDDLHISGILQNLSSMAKKLENQVDEELAKHVQTALELITRDYRRIQKKASNVSGGEEQQFYSNWMKKAKRWIELDTKLHDRAAIIDTVMKQLFLDLEEMIDQDLQIIFDYETHILADLPISADEKSRLEQVILAQISPHTQGLIQLKEQPANLQLYHLAQWREEIDLSRQKYFEKALHAIDTIIANLSPTMQLAEKNLPHEALMQEIKVLKDATDKLLKAFFQKEKDLNQLLPTFMLLQQQAHQMNGNLHLPQELFDQLMLIQQDLDKLGNYFQS